MLVCLMKLNSWKTGRWKTKGHYIILHVLCEMFHFCPICHLMCENGNKIERMQVLSNHWLDPSINRNQSPMDIKNTSIHLSISLDGKYFPKHKQTILHIGPCALSIALHYTSIHLFVSWWKMFFPNMCKNNMSHVCAIFIALHSKQLTWTSKIYQSISLFGKRYSQACPCVVSIIMHCKQITYLLSISISSLE